MPIPATTIGNPDNDYWQSGQGPAAILTTPNGNLDSDYWQSRQRPLAIPTTTTGNPENNHWVSRQRPLGNPDNDHSIPRQRTFGNPDNDRWLSRQQPLIMPTTLGGHPDNDSSSWRQHPMANPTARSAATTTSAEANHIIKRLTFACWPKSPKNHRKKATKSQHIKSSEANTSHPKINSAFGQKSTTKNQPKSQPKTNSSAANASRYISLGQTSTKKIHPKSSKKVQHIKSNQVKSKLTRHHIKSSHRHFVGEGAAADSQRYNGADGMTEVDGEAALAHLAVAEVHRAFAKVLLHHKVALFIVANEPRGQETTECRAMSVHTCKQSHFLRVP